MKIPLFYFLMLYKYLFLNKNGQIIILTIYVNIILKDIKIKCYDDLPLRILVVQILYTNVDFNYCRYCNLWDLMQK